jgi:hypothetical protein
MTNIKNAPSEIDGLICVQCQTDIAGTIRTTGESVSKPRMRTSLSARAWSKSRLSGLSRGALKDELVYQLSSAAKMDLKIFEIVDKYHERAKAVLYRINLYDLSAIDTATTDSKAIFVINTSDITEGLYFELKQLKESDPKGFDELVTEAVQTLLEGINNRYYHIAGLPYKVIWRFEL